MIFYFLSFSFIISFLLHEFDAIYEQEWKMFKFLSKLKSKDQYLIFLYSHIFICGIFIYYLWCVYNFTNLPLLLCINLFGISHVILHLFAKNWGTNVFTSFSSFLLIWSIGFFSLCNIILLCIELF